MCSPCVLPSWSLEAVLGGNHVALCLSGDSSAHHGLVEEAGQLGAVPLPGMEQQEVPCQLHHWAFASPCSFLCLTKGCGFSGPGKLLTRQRRAKCKMSLV